VCCAVHARSLFLAQAAADCRRLRAHADAGESVSSLRRERFRSRDIRIGGGVTEFALRLSTACHSASIFSVTRTRGTKMGPPPRDWRGRRSRYRHLRRPLRPQTIPPSGKVEACRICRCTGAPHLVRSKAWQVERIKQPNRITKSEPPNHRVSSLEVETAGDGLSHRPNPHTNPTDRPDTTYRLCPGSLFFVVKRENCLGIAHPALKASCHQIPQDA
jgi:hypothetical protein